MKLHLHVTNGNSCRRLCQLFSICKTHRISALLWGRPGARLIILARRGLAELILASQMRVGVGAQLAGGAVIVLGLHWMFACLGAGKQQHAAAPGHRNGATREPPSSPTVSARRAAGGTRAPLCCLLVVFVAGAARTGARQMCAQASGRRAWRARLAKPRHPMLHNPDAPPCGHMREAFGPPVDTIGLAVAQTTKPEPLLLTAQLEPTSGSEVGRDSRADPAIVAALAVCIARPPAPATHLAASGAPRSWHHWCHLRGALCAPIKQAFVFNFGLAPPNAPRRRRRPPALTHLSFIVRRPPPPSRQCQRAFGASPGPRCDAA